MHDTSVLKGAEVGLYFDDEDAFFEFLDEGVVDLSAPVGGPMAGMLVAARPVCKDPGILEEIVTGGGDESDASGSCESGRQFKITSSNVNALLGTIHIPNDVLTVDTTMPVSEEAAFTIMVVGRMELKQSPTLVLNSDYALTDVPVPSGFQEDTGIPRLIH